jgi:hypothetical protein
MGMPLVRVDLVGVEPVGATDGDRALRVLRTLRALAWPFVEMPPSPALCGFLFTGRDRMRLYATVEEAGGLVAADVRLSGGVTPLSAALPSLVREGRWTVDGGRDRSALRVQRRRDGLVNAGWGLALCPVLYASPPRT